MIRWGVVTTTNAPVEKILAFIAHHLACGAAEVWVFVDDAPRPDQPPLARHFAQTAHRHSIKQIDCDAAYWQKRGKRPERHQNRQMRNAQIAYRRCDLDWIAHIDVDEFLHAPRDIGTMLQALAQDRVMLRMAPFEALHAPDLPDDIFTAAAFRGDLRGLPEGLRADIFGGDQDILPEGLLSHSAGKAFYRTKVAGLSPRLHGAFMEKERLHDPDFSPDIKILHFHAQDRDNWLQLLPHRLSRGAYQYRPALQAYLSAASADEIAAFYARTQSLTPAQQRALKGTPCYLEARLGLRETLARMRL